MSRIHMVAGGADASTWRQLGSAFGAVPGFRGRLFYGDQFFQISLDVPGNLVLLFQKTEDFRYPNEDAEKDSSPQQKAKEDDK